MTKKNIYRILLSLILMVTFSFPSYAFNDFYQRGNSINAGFYLRIPFGPTKKNEDRLKYGLRLNMSQELGSRQIWNPGFRLNNQRTLNADIMSFNFSENGFNNIAFAGQQAFIYQNGQLRFAGKDSKKGGTSTIIWIFAGVGAAMIVAVVVNQVTKNDGNNPPFGN
ncbi:hypothetical protein MNBD_ALPHA02-65 [hydrothermal vent metagenome]|uniref:Uncharacterized protein n=1 Tax=hydrothermal vent metagenome TaxID=652676 RepID=A0A3B0RMY8_9ZZZZ